MNEPRAVPPPPGPLVSVIMPAFNRGKQLTASIESVLTQTYTRFELIVVDDGSTDDTARIIEGLQARYPHAALRYIIQERSGVAKARNRGIAEAAGEYIAFLDSDDTWLPDNLERKMAFFAAAADENVRVVFSDYYIHTAAAEREVYLVTRHFPRMFARSMRPCTAGGYIMDGRFYELCVRWFQPIFTGTVMVKRECFDTVGVFKESMPLAEDISLFYALCRVFRVGYLDAPLAHYYRLGDGETGRKKRLFVWCSIFWQSMFRREEHNRRLRSYITKKLSGFYAAMGTMCFKDGKIRSALTLYRAAFAGNPLNQWAWKGILRCWQKRYFTRRGRVRSCA